MKSNCLFAVLCVLLASLLSACGKLDKPVPGSYRAYVKLQGGEAPFELQLSEQNGSTVIGILNEGELQLATGVKLQDGKLEAQLPDAAGTLHADIGRRSLTGELSLIDPQGKPQTLPFAADLKRNYRFIATASTDNADVSGYWQLQATSPEQFETLVTLHLQQHFDAVDGELRLPDGKTLAVLGQMQGDEVYLSALGEGRAVLLKGRVNQQGELQGELWTNLSSASKWVAKRVVDDPAALVEEDAAARKVGLPWIIPAQ